MLENNAIGEDFGDTRNKLSPKTMACNSSIEVAISNSLYSKNSFFARQKLVHATAYDSRSAETAIETHSVKIILNSQKPFLFQITGWILSLKVSISYFLVLEQYLN